MDPAVSAARLQLIRCQFARVVKGVDLRSTTGNCAWVRTPQLTRGVLVCEPCLPHGRCTMAQGGTAMRLFRAPWAGRGVVAGGHRISMGWRHGGLHNSLSRKSSWPNDQPNRGAAWQGGERWALAMRSRASSWVPRAPGTLPTPPPGSRGKCCPAAAHQMSVCPSGKWGWT